jgi:DNA primase small subunit
LIEENFDEFIVRGQDIMNDQRFRDLMIMIIKAHFHHKNDYETLENKIRNIFNAKEDSQSKWNKIYLELVNNCVGEKKRQGSKFTTAELCMKEIKLNVLYPRLDINVSKHINHLLKSPFCVHPKTGLISVPMTEEDIVGFSLENIPSITDSIDDFMSNR